MEDDDGVHRSICCRRLLSADSRRSNGKLGIVDVGHLDLVSWWRFAVCGMGMAKSCDNLTFYLLEWIYFRINKLENSATTRLCFM